MNKHFETLVTMILIIVFIASVIGMAILITNFGVWFIGALLAAPLWAKLTLILGTLGLLYYRIYNEP